MKKIVLSLCLATTMSLSAADRPAPAPATLTPEYLVEVVMANNAELKFYEAEIRAAKGQRTQAGLWQNPEFSAEYGERRIKNSSNQLQDEGTTRRFAITQTFEFPGKGSLRKAIANKDIELAELGLQQFRSVLDGRVRSLALQYQGASLNAAAAAEISERSSTLIKHLQERPLAGTVQLLELRVIEGSLMELQQSTKEFIQEREESRIELNTLLGWPATQALNIQAPATVPKLRTADVNQLILAALSGNLQLKIHTAELEKAMKEVSASKLEVAPDFSVGPFFSQDKAGEREENVGGTLSVTLPLWNWNQGNITTAKARKSQADALLLQARRNVEAEMARRYRAYELNRKQLEQIPDTSISHLQDASDLADRQYRTGAVGVQLFLEMQRQFLSALKIRNTAVLEAWNNWLDIELLLGGTGEKSGVGGTKK